VFRCAITGELSKPREGAMKLVTHVRNKNYTRYDHKTDEEYIIGRGTEVVCEVLVTRAAYDKAMAEGFTPTLVKEKRQS